MPRDYACGGSETGSEIVRGGRGSYGRGRGGDGECVLRCDRSSDGRASGDAAKGGGDAERASRLIQRIVGEDEFFYRDAADQVFLNDAFHHFGRYRVIPGPFGIN